MGRKLLLACGILASLLYIGMNAFVPALFEGYSVVSQTVSELSAIGAPTRPLWVWLGTLYALLICAFGWGVWQSAGRSRALRVVAVSFILDGLLSVYWPPMQLRGSDFALTDALHIVWSIATVLLMTVAIAFAAVASANRFRLYSVATLLILLGFGALTGMEGPKISANLPTPWIGVWERISIAAFMFWVVALAVKLLHTPSLRSAGNSAAAPCRR